MAIHEAVNNTPLPEAPVNTSITFSATEKHILTRHPRFAAPKLYVSFTRRSCPQCWSDDNVKRATLRRQP
jgi:hypothetical protein